MKEASRLLQQRGGKIWGGGTDLLSLMRMRLEKPLFIVSLGAIPGLSFIRYQKGQGLRIGAFTPLASICSSSDVKEQCPMLAKAIEKIASPQIRNAATLGGNILLDTKCPYYNQSPLWIESGERCLKAGGDQCLAVRGQDSCYAVWSSDTAPALIALGARIKVTQGRQQRWLLIDRLYTGLGDRPCNIAADEIVTEVLIPESSCRVKAAYRRHSQRDVIDFPVVSVAVAHYSTKKAADFRIVAGGVDPAPKRLLRTEALLNGQTIDGNLARQAGAAAAREVGPIKDVFYPSRFKREVLGALVEDAILACVADGNAD
ncbi:MAG: FAD binding domain-containing protein [Deltaproteobacteria bacterium]|nr:FAD binding domain-containing protein [Deltaproteobacteria bacterium]